MFGLFLIIILAIIVILYVLQALGFYKLSKNRDLNHAWLAWIPICQNYQLGELVENEV